MVSSVHTKIHTTTKIKKKNTSPTIQSIPTFFRKKKKKKKKKGSIFFLNSLTNSFGMSFLLYSSLRFSSSSLCSSFHFVQRQNFGQLFWRVCLEGLLEEALFFFFLPPPPFFFGFLNVIVGECC